MNKNIADWQLKCVGSITQLKRNDLLNGGHGAPLTPIFHKLLKEKFKIKEVTFVNIGGIVNTTTILNNGEMTGTDIGPGMCLIDRWIRIKSKIILLGH